MPDPVFFVVPDVCRYTINGQFYGRACDNVIDMQIDTTGSTMSRNEAIAAQAGILINQWVADILPALSSSYLFNSVSWVDLNSTTGGVGSRLTSGAITLPRPGLVGGETMPAMVALLVKKATVTVRGSRQGRMYLGGFTEANSVGADVAPSTLTAMNTKVQAFRDNIDQEDSGTTGHDSRWVVVHIDQRVSDIDPTRPSDDRPVSGSYSPITGVSCDSRWATQRRRQRG